VTHWGTCGVAIAALAVFVFGGATVSGIRLNTSPSMPRGLWIEHAVPAQVHRGDVVAACLEPSEALKYYLGPGDCQSTSLEPVIKPVVAVAGDTVAITEAGVVVNGSLVRHSARLSRDGHGRSMAILFPSPIEGTVVVPRGLVWLVAPMDESFDSRYLGPVRTSSIIAIADPLLVE
jgi:conjugative transfer signal peptidase TraF